MAAAKKKSSSAAQVRMADTKATKAANAKAPRYPRGLQGYGTTDKMSGYENIDNPKANKTTTVRSATDKRGNLVQVVYGSLAGTNKALQSNASGAGGKSFDLKNTNKTVSLTKGSSPLPVSSKKNGNILTVVKKNKSGNMTYKPTMPAKKKSTKK